VVIEPADYFSDVTKKLIDHTVKYGYDRKMAVYTQTDHEGQAIITDKEFWQNSEALVGFLDTYEKFGNEPI
jgi:hypothetical protein